MAAKKVVAQTPAEQVAEAAALNATGFDLTAKALGNIADIWFNSREERLVADKVAAKLKLVEDQAYALLIEQLRRQELTGIGGKRVRVGLDPEPDYRPHVTDWPAFYAYIKQEEAWDLLERRPGKAACQARWEDDIAVPGVEKFPVYKLTRSAVK